MKYGMNLKMIQKLSTRWNIIGHIPNYKHFLSKVKREMKDKSIWKIIVTDKNNKDKTYTFTGTVKEHESYVWKKYKKGALAVVSELTN